MSQLTLIEGTTPPTWTIFHDESLCEQERFLYHGFLCVTQHAGHRILNRLLEPGNGLGNNYDKRVHFTDLRRLQGQRAHTAVCWVRLALDEWLPSGSLRFYCMGVNLKNINYNLYRASQPWAPDLPNKNDRVYRRFYEIGLKATLAWFGVTERAVTHVYYDKGKQDIDRFNRTLSVCGPDTVVKALANDCTVSGIPHSKYLQLADVLLGTVRKTFAGPAPSATAQVACVRELYDLVEWFSNTETTYNPESPYWKKFCLSFFPRHADITAEEFFGRDLEYHRKVGELFYCDRKTHREKVAAKAQTSFFPSGD